MKSVLILINLLYFVFGQNDDSFVLDSELPYDCGFANITLKDYKSDVDVNVTFGSWPWIGALFDKRDNKKILLGNTILIHERITLGSLRQTFHAENLAVIFKGPEINDYQSIKVSKVQAYTGYKYTFFDLDDMSILLLSKKVVISDYAKPICLWEARETSLDVYEMDGILATVDDGEYELRKHLVLRYEPVRTLSAVLCMTLNTYSNSESSLVHTEVSEQQMCVGAHIQAFCPPTGAALFFPRESLDGRTQYYLRAIAIKRIFAANLPTEPCKYPSRKWVMIDVAQRRQFIDSHLKKKVRCGKRQLLPTALIKGGKEAKPGYWPWHIALFHNISVNHTYKFYYQCGGSLLNSYTILTSGHCVTVRATEITLNIDIFKVELGRYYLNGDEITAQSRYVREVILHPKYNGTNLRDDVAVLKLKTPALYNDYVQPICLWESDKISKSFIVEKLGTVVGWGRTNESTTAAKLQETSIPVVNDSVCYQSHVFFSKFLNDDKFCAGFKDGTGVCNGDSGGGMYFGQVNEVDTIFYQRGIVSIGMSQKDRSCDLYNYILFVDVARYLDWIRLYLS